MQTEPITVLIVDDHTIVREGIHAFLDAHPGLSVVGEAATGENALRLVEELLPDVVLMDLLMPGMNGVEATRAIKHISPQTQIVVLTSYHEDEHIFPALRAGALSYLLKTTCSQELVETIRKAARGEAVLSPSVATRVIQEVRETKRKIPPAFLELTERELEVLRQISAGHSNAVIAEKLVLSEKTVKAHVRNIFSKLQLTDRTQAAVFAWKQGLMREE